MHTRYVLLLNVYVIIVELILSSCCARRAHGRPCCEWLAPHSPVITPLLPGRLRGRISPSPSPTRASGEYLQSKQKKNTNTTLAAPLAHTVNDPTCFRCRVGRFSEFEFRLPTRSNGPSITRIDGFGAKKTRKKLARWKQTILRAVLVSEAIMRCQFGYVMFFFKNNTKTKVLHVLDKVWIKSNLAYNLVNY